MFGIGLDDAFVIFGEYIRTDERKDPVERIQDTFEEVGLSIFLTTLTTTLAFGLGCLASLPAVFWLFMYAFPTVLIDFLFMITFFVAIIVVDERRIKERELEKLHQEQQPHSPDDEITPVIYRIIDFCLRHDYDKNHLPAALTEERENKPRMEHASIHDRVVTEMLNNSQDLNDPRHNDDEQTHRISDQSECDARAAESRKSVEGAPEMPPRRQSLLLPQMESCTTLHHHVPSPPASIMDHFMKWYASKLMTTPAKIAVLVAFSALTAGLAYSATKFTQEFNIYEVLTDDSYVAGFFENIDKYADRGFAVPEAYFRNVNQADPVVQQQMKDYIDDLVTIDSITSPPPFFWLEHFEEFLTYDERLLDFPFNTQLDFFFTVPVFQTLYGDHIVRDPETRDIIASRCVMYMDELDMASVDNQIQAWREQLDVTEEQPINHEENLESKGMFNFFLYEGTTLYVWEFYNVMIDELVLSSIIGMCSVALVTFLFLPHWTASLFITPILAALYVDLVGEFSRCVFGSLQNGHLFSSIGISLPKLFESTGFLQLCGVHLNAISYFTIVMSIGLLVDFNMHILLRYYESPCATREDKVKDALQTMGSSVVIGGLSTFLGVVPLLFSSSIMMKNLFFGFWGMVILGMSHGTILLPVLLSYAGPIRTVPVSSTDITPDDISEVGRLMTESPQESSESAEEHRVPTSRRIAALSVTDEDSASTISSPPASPEKSK